MLQNAAAVPGQRERHVHAAVANTSSPRRGRLVSHATLSPQNGLQEESLRQEQVQLIIPIIVATMTLLTLVFCSQINRRRNCEIFYLYQLNKSVKISFQCRIHCIFKKLNWVKQSGREHAL